MAIHEGHLILVLEVAHGAQPANEQRRTDLLREVDEQSAERVHLDSRLVLHRLADERHPLLDREERGLGGVDGHGDDEPVHELETAVHEILMPARDRIEAAGVDGDSGGRHGGKCRMGIGKRQPPRLNC